MKFPQIIQGGMGIGISSWQLARSVSLKGQIGIVSSTAIELVLIRKLQIGDPGGHLRRAFKAFPDQSVTARVLEKYFIEGGKPDGQPFLPKPMASDKLGWRLKELIIVANFTEVYLAKEDHDGLVGINFLHKIQTPFLPALYGAMLAEVDIVAVGAGIPLEIPKIIDGLCRGDEVTFTLHVQGTKNEHLLTFDPQTALSEEFLITKRPLFFPIVSSVTLATVMAKKCLGKVSGLIIEGPSAGGHNAPPRGAAKLNEKGEPIYGPRDDVNFEAIKSLGLPFWLAGSYGTPEKLASALATGATGIQLGTLFAFSDESGLRSDLKADIVGKCKHPEELEVFKDPLASPTGFPFQVLSVKGSLSDQEVYEDRCRQCDLGFLRESYEREDGSLGWRCKAEDPAEYVKKGGKLEDTIGRKCLCNSLMANIGLAQIRKSDSKDSYIEPTLITCGEDMSSISALLGRDKSSYQSSDVIDYLLS